MSLNQIEYLLASDLFGYIGCAAAALKRMSLYHYGHIINLGSLSADAVSPGGDVYTAMKGAIRAWSRSLALSVADFGIKVTLIEPGNVGTDFRGTESPQYQMESEKKLFMLTAEDIAESIYYCVSQPMRCDIISMQIRPHLQKL